jgi:hypothetical protein
VKREPLPVFYISAPLLTSTSKYYDLLEVSPNASEADLKKAYRKKFSVLQLFFSNCLTHGYPELLDYILTKVATPNYSKKLPMRMVDPLVSNSL